MSWSQSFQSGGGSEGAVMIWRAIAVRIECLLRCSCDPQNTINQESSSLWLLTDYCPIRRRGISVSCETDETLIQG